MTTTKKYILEGYAIKENSLIEFKSNSITNHTTNIKDEVEDLETLILTIANENDLDKQDVKHMSQAIDSLKKNVSKADNTANTLKVLAGEIHNELNSLEQSI